MSALGPPQPEKPELIHAAPQPPTPFCPLRDVLFRGKTDKKQTKKYMTSRREKCCEEIYSTASEWFLEVRVVLAKVIREDLSEEVALERRPGSSHGAAM